MSQHETQACESLHSQRFIAKPSLGAGSEWIQIRSEGSICIHIVN